MRLLRRCVKDNNCACVTGASYSYAKLERLRRMKKTYKRIISGISALVFSISAVSPTISVFSEEYGNNTAAASANVSGAASAAPIELEASVYGKTLHNSLTGAGFSVAGFDVDSADVTMTALEKDTESLADIPADMRRKLVYAFTTGYRYAGITAVPVSGSAVMQYELPDEVPESDAESVRVYSLGEDGEWKPLDPDKTVENGYVRYVTFASDVCSDNTFAVVYTDPASTHMDEAILSDDRAFTYADDRISADVTAFKGAVCTYGDFPVNVNDVYFSVTEGAPEDVVLPDETAGMHRTVYSSGFGCEEFTNADVSDYEAVYTYTLSAPLKEGFEELVKVYTYDGNAFNAVETEFAAEDGIAGAVRFTTDSLHFVIDEPVVTAEQLSIEYSDDAVSARAEIPQNAVLVNEDGVYTDHSGVALSVAPKAVTDETVPFEAGEGLAALRYEIRFSDEQGNALRCSEHSTDVTVTPADDIYVDEGTEVTAAVFDGTAWQAVPVDDVVIEKRKLKTFTVNNVKVDSFTIVYKPLCTDPFTFTFEDHDISASAEVSFDTAFYCDDKEITADNVHIKAEMLSHFDARFTAVPKEDSHRLRVFETSFVTDDGKSVTLVPDDERETPVKTEVSLGVPANCHREKLDSVKVYTFDAEAAAPVEIPYEFNAEKDAVIVHGDGAAAYALSYPVDYLYDDLEYNFNCAHELLLSDMLSYMDIPADLFGSSVELTGEGLAAFEPVLDSFGNVRDWKITGIKDFDTEEALVVTLSDGNLIRIRIRNYPAVREFEYTDDNISVVVEVKGGSIFTDSSGNEVYASDVALVAVPVEDVPANMDINEDERVAAYDIGFETAGGEAVDVEIKSSAVSIVLDSGEDEKISGIEVYSLDSLNASPVEDAEVDEKAAEVTVENDRLSGYAVKYTVDFHYGDYDYSIEGGSEILLSKLFEILEIDESTKGSEAKFSDESLVKLIPVTEEDTVTDWRIVSLRPFDTEELLSVRLAGGGTVDIAVTDANETRWHQINNLNMNLVEGAEKAVLFTKAAESYKNDDGSYTIPEGFHYTLPDGTVKEFNSSEYTVTDGMITIPAASVPADEGWVWTPTSSDKDHRVVYRLDISTSGVGYIYPGEFEIRVPKSILLDAENNPADSLELSVVTRAQYEAEKETGKAADSINFAYDVVKEGDEEYLVFTNVSTLDSAFDGNIWISYHTTKNTYDYQDMSRSKDCGAEATIYTLYDNSGNPLYKYSDDPAKDDFVTYLVDQSGSKYVSAVSGGQRTHDGLGLYKKSGDSYEQVTSVASEVYNAAPSVPVYIDTSAAIKSVSKSLNQSNVYQYWQSAWGEKPSDADKYIYFVWEITSEIATQQDNPTKVTQRYDFTLTADVPDTEVTDLFGASVSTKQVEHQIIKFRLAGQNTWKDWVEGDTAGRTVTGLTDASGMIRRDYVITRVKADDINEAGHAYTIWNRDAATTVTPHDNVDAPTSKEADAKFTYAVPKYTEPASDFRIDKVGVYKQTEDTVSNERQISSYMLKELKTEEDYDIEGLRYHVNVTAENLPDTFKKDNGELTHSELDVPYYQQSPVQYKLTDNDVSLRNVRTNGAETPLDEGDYTMTAVDVQAVIKAGFYDNKLKAFSSVNINDVYKNGTSGIDGLSDSATFTSLIEDNAHKVELRLYIAGSDTPVTVAEYDAYNGQWSNVDGTYVTQVASPFSGFVRFVFNGTTGEDPATTVTGYELYSSNKFYGTYYKAYPTVTLRGSDKVKSVASDPDADSEDSSATGKVQLNNYAALEVTGEKASHTLNSMGKVYISEATRSSKLTKAYIPTDYNNIMDGEYYANWDIEFAETMTMGDNETVPVRQDGGVFYDLLPIMSTASISDIKIYAVEPEASRYSTTPLYEGGDYTLSYDYLTDSAGFRRVLLKLDITHPADKYRVNVTTIHTHTDIIDYGRNIRNSVVYKSKNPNIGSGHTNANGDQIDENTELRIYDGSVFEDYASEMGDADKKKFAYTQATHYIPALISTVSGIKKRVYSVKTTPVVSDNAVVTPGEEYVYTYRNMNLGSTFSKNLVILDSIENYGERSATDHSTINGAISEFGDHSHWKGTPLRFDMALLDSKGYKYRIYVTTTEQLDLEKYDDKSDPSTASIGDSTFEYKVDDSGNLIVTDVNSPGEIALAGYTVQGSDIKHNGEVVPLDGGGDIIINDGDTPVRYTPVKVLTPHFVENALGSGDGWTEIEQHYSGGEYTFTEKDGTPFDFSKIKAFMIYFEDEIIYPNQSVSFSLVMRAPYTIDEQEGDAARGGEITYNNVYRYHDTSENREFPAREGMVSHTYVHQDRTAVNYRVTGDLYFRKTDKEEPDKPVTGAVFTLTGNTVYGSTYKKVMTTDSRGEVHFTDLEQGTYILEETDPTKNYLAISPMTVKVDANGVATISGPDDIYSFDISVIGAPEHEYTLTGGTLNRTASADNEGLLSIDDVPSGSYTLTDTTASPAVEWSINAVDGHEAKIRLSSAGEGQADYTYNDNGYKIRLINKEYGIYDEPLRVADIRFRKNLIDTSLPEGDSGYRTPLSGATFKLTTVGNGSGDNSGKNGYGEVVTEYAVSDEQGEVKFYDIPIGKYLLTEEAEGSSAGESVSGVPMGVVPENKTYYVWVRYINGKTVAYIQSLADKDGDWANGVQIPKEKGTGTYYLDNYKTVNVKIFKRDSKNLSEPLPNAEFELFPYGTVNEEGTVTAATDALFAEYEPTGGETSNEYSTYPEEVKIYEKYLNSAFWKKSGDWTLASAHLDAGSTAVYAGDEGGHKTQWKRTDSHYGMATFTELQPGVAYYLVETTAPENHEDVSINTGSALPYADTYWTVIVKPNGKVVIKDKSGTEVQYISESNIGEGYRLTNERTYGSKFNVSKLWIGDPTEWGTTFPVFNVSTAEEQVVLKSVVATINSDLFKKKFPTSATSFTRLDVATNSGDPTFANVEEAWARIQELETTVAGLSLEDAIRNGTFNRVDVNSDLVKGIKNDWSENGNAYATSGNADKYWKQGDIYPTPDGGTAVVDYTSEEGQIYMACINNHTYFWSDANKIYLPKRPDKDAGAIFINRKSLSGPLDLTNFYADRVTRMFAMVEYCSASEIRLPNIDNCYNVTSMEYLFNGCNNTTKIVLPNEMNCQNVTSFYRFMKDTKNVSADFVTQLITSDKLNNIEDMFKSYGANSSKTVIIDLGQNFDTSAVTKADHAFAEMFKTTFIGLGQATTFANTPSLYTLFENDYLVTQIRGTEYFAPSQCTNVDRMFSNLKALTSIDLSGFDTSNVTNFQWMFYNCNNLTSVVGLENFNTSKATTFEYMFYGCEKLPDINVTNFDTSNATTLKGIFQNCKAVTTMDISSFSTEKVTVIHDIFQGCEKLEVVYANPYEWPAKASDKSNTFKDCKKLKLRIEGVASDYRNKNDGEYAAVNVSTYDSSKSGYGVNVNNEYYVGYFTDWSKSPNYVAVYDRYFAKHPERAASGNNGKPSLLSKLAAVSGQGITDKVMLLAGENALLGAENEGEEETETYTPPVITYSTTQTVISDNAALDSIFHGAGNYDLPGDNIKYVKETVTIDGVLQYDVQLAAKWERFSDDEWYCTLMVYDAKAQAYVWEDELKYDGTKTYECDHYQDNQYLAEAIEDEETDVSGITRATITNKREEAEEPRTGSLTLSKLITENSTELPETLRTADTFTFNIKFTKGTSEKELPPKATYGGVIFTRNDNGTPDNAADDYLEGTVTMHRTVQTAQAGTEEDPEVTEYGVFLDNIPEGYYYTISEDTTAYVLTDRAFEDDYTSEGAVTAGTVVTGKDPETDSIVADVTTVVGDVTETVYHTKHVTWRNEVKNTSLEVEKELTRFDKAANAEVALTDSDKLIEYEFTVELSGLLPGAEYSYTVADKTVNADGEPYKVTADEKGSAKAVILLRHGEKAVFSELPVRAAYGVTETQPYELNAEYSTGYVVTEYNSDGSVNTTSAEVSGTSLSGETLDRKESVTFRNQKSTNRTIDVTVRKEWMQDGLIMSNEGEYSYADKAGVPFEMEATIALRRASNGNTTDMPGSNQVLSKDNNWSYTYSDLPLEETVNGTTVHYTYRVGEYQVNGYNQGLIATYVGDGTSANSIVYRIVDELRDSDNQLLGYFGYKRHQTINIGGNKITNAVVQKCWTNDGNIYIVYKNEIYKCIDKANYKYEKDATDLKKVSSTLPHFTKMIDHNTPGVGLTVYETYTINDGNTYYVDSAIYNDGDTAICANEDHAVQAIVEGNDVKFIRFGSVYKEVVSVPEGYGDGKPLYKLKEKGIEFTLNSSEKTISDVNGNMHFIITNVKEDTCTLEIEKTVSGNMGNKVRDFEFKLVSRTNLNGSYPVEIQKNGVFDHLETIEFNGGMGQTTIKLTHDQAAVITDLPKNTNMTVSEVGFEEMGYTVSSEVIHGDDPEISGGEAPELFLEDGIYTVKFNNDLKSQIPTGVDVDAGATAVVFIGMLAVMTFLYMGRRREE